MRLYCRAKGVGKNDALAGLAVVLAIGSYYFAEQPFRGKGAMLRSRARVFAVSISGLLIFIALGLAAVATSGFPARFTPQLDTTS